jgi:hypothetical protein
MSNQPEPIRLTPEQRERLWKAICKKCNERSYHVEQPTCWAIIPLVASPDTCPILKEGGVTCE